MTCSTCSRKRRLIDDAKKLLKNSLGAINLFVDFKTAENRLNICMKCANYMKGIALKPTCKLGKFDIVNEVKKNNSKCPLKKW